MTTAKHITSRKARPTIGVISANIVEPWELLQWLGVVDAARERDINLICFPGRELRSPRGFDAQANVLYNLVNVEKIDGLVIWNGALGEYVDQKEAEDFCKRYHPLPIVSAHLEIKGVPSVYLDNYQAMHEAIVHLIEVHGYRRIAFIRGPEGFSGLQERYRAYTEILAEYGLPLDPGIVRFGYREDLSSEEIANWLLDEQHIPVEAVVGHNDSVALIALQGLQARGERIPQDIAVVGFDNIAEGRTVTPPLTTVQPPFYEMGRKAVEMLLAMIAGKTVPERVMLSGELVVRESCGCMSPAVVQAASEISKEHSVGESFEAALAERREAVLSEMGHAVGISERTSDWTAHLLDGFAAEMIRESPGMFLQALKEVLPQTITLGGDITAWHGVLSTLRRHMLSCLSNDDALSLAENLWQQAQVMIGETARRVQEYQALQKEQRAKILREIGARLMSTFDVAELMNVLAEGLPRLEISSGYLSLYEEPQPYQDPQPVPLHSRLILGYDEKGRVALEPDGRRFPSHQLVPDGILPWDRAYRIVIEPLYFQEDQLGFVLFEVGPRDGSVYEALRGQICGALKGERLFQERKRAEESLAKAYAEVEKRVEKRTAELEREIAERKQVEEALAREQYLFRTLMDNTPDHIYFKDTASRFIRVNKAQADRFGLSDPVQAIGKTDFDFFSAEHAQQAYADEQRVITTGQPLVGIEEKETWPDGTETWVSTTKVPLRDEAGNIIGTFGISRDITQRRQAEEEIHKLNKELEQRVQERTAELQETNRFLKDSVETLQLAQEQLVRTEKMAMLGNLVAGVTHEISTPLGIGVTAASYLEQLTREMKGQYNEGGMTRSDLENYLKTAEQSTAMILKNLGRAADHIQSFKQVAVDQASGEKRTFKLKEYIGEVLLSLHPKLKKTSHTIMVDCPEDLEIVSYPGVFSQILTNLVINSLLHGFEDNVQGKIALDVIVEDGMLHLRYSDNGKGMTHDVRAHIFEPFYTTKRDQGGSGLGLYIVYNLVTQRLKGAITCESAPGQGTTFLIQIPLEKHGP